MASSQFLRRNKSIKNFYGGMRLNTNSGANLEEGRSYSKMQQYKAVPFTPSQKSDETIPCYDASTKQFNLKNYATSTSSKFVSTYPSLAVNQMDVDRLMYEDKLK